MGPDNTLTNSFLTFGDWGFDLSTGTLTYTGTAANAAGVIAMDQLSASTFGYFEGEPYSDEIIEIYQPAPHVIICTFADGKKEKAVCMPDDTFDMETGIAVCLAKHALGGASNYHKAIKRGVRVAKEQEARKAEESRLEEIKKKRIDRAKRRKEAYKARKREERIIEMAEARVRAQKIYEAEKLKGLIYPSQVN